MGRGRPAVDPRWACPALGQANDLGLRIASLLREGLANEEILNSPRLESIFVALGKVQHLLLTADAAFKALQAKGGGE